MRNAKSFEKVVRRDGRPVAVDGYHQHFVGKLVVKRRHATVERHHARTTARRTSGSLARRSTLTDDMIVRLSIWSTGGGFGGTGVGIEIPEVGVGGDWG